MGPADRGGPLLQSDGVHWSVVGVISGWGFDTDCADAGRPVVFAKTHRFRAFAYGRTTIAWPTAAGVATIAGDSACWGHAEI